MNFEEAIRLTEILVGCAFIQQSLEHIKSSSNEKIIFLPRLILSIVLVTGFYTSWILILLFILSLVILNRFQGPYNGGADRMSLLILICLLLTHLAPNQYWKEVAFGYLALQLVLSYFISGWVKIVNSDWRNGSALRDVFEYSAYPVSQSLRGWAKSPRLLLLMSWLVMLFELIFPLSLFSQQTLIFALVVAAGFHFANACLFGLNRFFWIWIAAYPSILWFQLRLSFIM